MHVAKDIERQEDVLLKKLIFKDSETIKKIIDLNPKMN